MSLLANAWAQRGWQVTLVTLSTQESDFYFLNQEICRVGLDLVGNSRNLAETLGSNFRRLTALRRVIVESRAHVVVSFLDQINVLTLLATLGKKLPIIVSERTDPRYHVINGIWSALRWLAYRRALAVIVQTQEVADWARRNLGCSSVAVIPNPVILSDDSPSEVLLPQEPFIVSAGRLVYEKGFDRLLAAFAQSLIKGGEWHLIILGEGEESDALHRQAAALDISEQVHFLGCVRNPSAVMRQAEFFVLSSHYEGFPNVLLEAMACGLPVISFDCPSGSREIIRPGIDGVLVAPDDVDGLAQAMVGFMQDKEKRRKLASRAPEVLKRYNSKKILELWDEVFYKATSS